jgi:hypothetical protein
MVTNRATVCRAMGGCHQMAKGATAYLVTRKYFSQPSNAQRLDRTEAAAMSHDVAPWELNLPCICVPHPTWIKRPC